MRFVMVALLLLPSCGTRISLETSSTSTQPPQAYPLDPLPEVVLTPPALSPTLSPEEEPPFLAPSPPAPVSPPTLDVSTREETTVNGRLYDISGQPVDGEVFLESLQGTPVKKSNPTQGGSYVFNAIPAGVPLRITAKAPGYGTFSQTVVLKSNVTGNPDANRINFGGDPQSHTALLAGPQLTQISPDRLRPFEAQDAIALGLRFDRPVDRNSIQQSLTIITRQALNIGSFTLPAKAPLLPAKRMHWEWQRDNIFATVYLPRLPVTDQALSLALHFTKPFQSQSGSSSLLTPTGQVPFRLKQTLQTESHFSVNPDTQPLRLVSLRYQKPQVRLQFNKPLAFLLGDQEDAVSPEGLSRAEHYVLQIDTNGDGRFDTLEPPSQADIQHDLLTLDFGDLSAYANCSARLAFQQGFVPKDLAGHSLETSLSSLIQL